LVVGTERGDHTGRLCVFDESAFRTRFNYPRALLSQGIAQHTENFHALRFAPLGISEPALLDTHGNDAVESLLVRRRPAECLAQAVDARLVVTGHLAHGGAAPA
jgi:hypothetical protein